ncbi:MAG: hypothetical protein KIT34_15630 [Cyanobacteria bacterium TGS_CYA1]|nr:hypothetical protein [Cyanobacteria bacterium TGS_CYA1]
MTSVQPIEVLPFSIENFSNLIARKANFSSSEFMSDLRGIFFREYFEELKPLTIVVENSYIDQHYLDDYAGYYVRCLHNYGKYCTRLHFFSFSFNTTYLNAILEGNGEQTQLQDNYLGFMVVKPLPLTVIGRTCLQTYKDCKRTYPALQIYNANLAGIDLKVSSLAFQEQDRAASACASSALWSVFQATGVLFHHKIPSPFQITTLATENSPPLTEVPEGIDVNTRNLPSKGLSLFQMAQAIRAVGLEAYSVKVNNSFILKSTVYAYLKARIPILLMISLYKNGIEVGKHAVAITGFRTDGDPVLEYDCHMFSNRIVQFYVHDDQVGPFARMKVIDSTTLSTSYKAPGTYVAVPSAVLVPLLPTIRIPFGTVSDIVREFDAFVEQTRLTGAIPIESERLEWDVYLISVQDFRREIVSENRLSPTRKSEILTSVHPLYVWRAVAYEENSSLFELIFDSTDLEQGKLILDAISYSKNFSDNFASAARSVLSFASKKLSARLNFNVRFAISQLSLTE